MSDSTEIQQWKRVNEALLEKERHLMQLLVRYARGDVDADVVDGVRAEVAVIRELADAAFNQAFGPRSAGKDGIDLLL
jgi:hypothetical protein